MENSESFRIHNPDSNIWRMPQSELLDLCGHRIGNMRGSNYRHRDGSVRIMPRCQLRL